MSDYYCPNCGADIGEQEGFDPYDDYYFCKECGQLLTNPDSDDSGLKYPDTRWFCDNCEACLNKQDGFSDWSDTWECTECGYINDITENNMFESKEDYLNSKNMSQSDTEDEKKNRCPNCDAILDEQWLYSEYEDDWECTECGVHLHRDYWNDEYIIVDDDDDEDDDEVVEYSGEINSATSNNNDRIFDCEEYEKQRKKEAQKKARAEKRRAFRKRHWKAYLVSALIIVLFLAGTCVFYEVKQLVSIEYSSSELVGLDYKEVYQRLKNTGFKNINYHEIADLSADEILYENVVTDVKIGLKNSFKYGKKFPSNYSVTITFHSIEKIDVPITSKDAKGKNYKEVQDEFEQLGFANVEVTPEYDIVTGWITDDGEVESITINGDEKYSQGTSYRADVEIIITYHTLHKNKPKK